MHRHGAKRLGTVECATSSFRIHERLLALTVWANRRGAMHRLTAELTRSAIALGEKHDHDSEWAKEHACSESRAALSLLPADESRNDAADDPEKDELHGGKVCRYGANTARPSIDAQGRSAGCAESVARAAEHVLIKERDDAMRRRLQLIDFSKEILRIVLLENLARNHVPHRPHIRNQVGEEEAKLRRRIVHIRHCAAPGSMNDRRRAADNDAQASIGTTS
jgi:hypothetical protein